jgi:hypothetical protein
MAAFLGQSLRARPQTSDGAIHESPRLCYGSAFHVTRWVIRHGAIRSHYFHGLANSLQTVGLDMLPDLRFLVCGVLFCFLLFAVTGAGVRLPDARTRIGEMPQVVRPMMQRSMVEAPSQAQIHMMTVARRTSEPERLRDQPAAVEAAPAALAQPDTEPATPDAEKPDAETWPGLPKPDAVANPAPGGAAHDIMTAEDAEAPVRILPGDVARDDNRRDEAAEHRIAALAPPAAALGPGGPSSAEGGGEPVLVSRLVNVPLPQPRPAFFGAHRRAHLFRRRHRTVVVQRDLPAQGAAVQSAPGQSTQGAAVQSLPGQAAQGAVVQGWQAQGAVAATPAAEPAKR